MARKDLDWQWLAGADLQRLSEEMSPSSPKLARSKKWEPAVDVMLVDDHLIIRAEIAGVDIESIRVRYHSDRHSLILSGVRQEPDTHTRRRNMQLEIFYGEFEREIKLPEQQFDVVNLQANYRSGVLTLTLPTCERVPEETVITHTITIRRR